MYPIRPVRQVGSDPFKEGQTLSDPSDPTDPLSQEDPSHRGPYMPILGAFVTGDYGARLEEPVKTARFIHKP